jgi:hypothetical protein
MTELPKTDGRTLALQQFNLDSKETYPADLERLIEQYYDLKQKMMRGPGVGEKLNLDLAHEQLESLAITIRGRIQELDPENSSAEV